MEIKTALFDTALVGYIFKSDKIWEAIAKAGTKKNSGIIAMKLNGGM